MKAQAKEERQRRQIEATRLQSEQRERLAAQAELHQLKKDIEIMNEQLQQAQVPVFLSFYNRLLSGCCL